MSNSYFHIFETKQQNKNFQSADNKVSFKLINFYWALQKWNKESQKYIQENKKY